MAKPQRVRDPIHNLIEFGSSQFEEVLWRVIQTRPFQRLRRVKQLGFSELVYPGATHTRFAHSVGVFHTARHLMGIIQRHIRHVGTGKFQYKEQQEKTALAAALLHDVGHGMFSHSFEAVGKRLNLKMAHHVDVSDMLIRSGEISEVLKEMGSGFANDVADLIGRDRPGNLYDAVVSSQFDADRLDYMQRDRFMTGVQNSGIDFTWLMANLEVGEVQVGVDDKKIGKIETFVLGNKAAHAAETYVLALFQLYPTVYFHKATRGAEKIFTELMLRIITLAREGHTNKTSLAENHPIIAFAKEPDVLERALALDDTVFWGALPMLALSEDKLTATYARRLKDRKLLKCVDLQQEFSSEAGISRAKDKGAADEASKRVARMVVKAEEKLHAWVQEKSDGVPRILTDRVKRNPYDRFKEAKGSLNQIHILSADRKVFDVAEFSSVIEGLKTFEVFRAYVGEDDAEARDFVHRTIRDVMTEERGVKT